MHLRRCTDAVQTGSIRRSSPRLATLQSTNSHSRWRIARQGFDIEAAEGGAKVLESRDPTTIITITSSITATAATIIIIIINNVTFFFCILSHILIVIIVVLVLVVVIGIVAIVRVPHARFIFMGIGD